MSSPVNSTPNRQDQILNNAQSGIPRAWNGIKKVAGGIYGAAQWAWSKIPNWGGYRTSTENAWNNSQHKTAIKTATAVGAGTLAAVGAGTLAAGAIVLSAPVTIPALVTGAVGIGVGSALGIGVGGVVGSATLMAQYPDQSVMIHVPKRGILELRTPGTDSGDPVAPSVPLDAIRKKADDFTLDQPEGMTPKRLVEKIEDPQRAKDLKVQKDKTDKQVQRLIGNISSYMSVWVIFVNRLKMKELISAEGDEIVMEMSQAAIKPLPDGSKPKPWDAWISCLEKRGIKLTLIQRIRAKFLYAFTNFLGVIPNTFKDAGERVLAYFRNGIGGEQSKAAISRTLEILDSFLERYNSAAKNYAEAGLAGKPPLEGELADYRKRIIDQEGEDSCLARALSKWKPGEDVGKKVMEELCKDFVQTLVDDERIFPKIYFFKSFGLFSRPLEWLFGGLLNRFTKSAIKDNAPEALQLMIKKGIDETLPGKFAFKSSIANTIIEQVNELKEDIAKGIPSKPLRFFITSNEITEKENKKLNEIIGKLINTLELNGCGNDQAALRAKLAEIANPTGEALEIRDQMQESLIKAGQLLINRYTEKPEAMEKLFETLFSLSSEPLEKKQVEPTEEEYKETVGKLKTSVEGMLVDQVRVGVQENIEGEKPVKVQEILRGKMGPDGTTPLRDAYGKIIYKGLFTEEREQAQSTALVLKGLALKMAKQVHADAVATLPPPCRAVAPLSKEVIQAAKTEIAAAKANFDAAKKEYDAAAGSKDQIRIMTANNSLIEARIKLDIAKEKGQLSKEIEELENIKTALVQDVNVAEDNSPALDEAKTKLKAVQIKLRFAREELLLAPSMRPFNPLEAPNGSMLQNLANYMLVIDEFGQYVKSLNIDLYNDAVQKAINRTFVPIYQGFEHLAEQAVNLQALGKTHDKARRLVPLFAQLEATAAGDPSDRVPAIRKLLVSIKAIDEDFSEFRADPAKNIIPFEALFLQLEELSNGQHPNPALAKEKLQEIKELARERKDVTALRRKETHAAIAQKLEVLRRETQALAAKIDTAELPRMSHPVHALLHEGYLPRRLQNKAETAIDTHITQPIVGKLMKYARTGYEFITSKEIMEAGSRLALGEFIHNH